MSEYSKTNNLQIAEKLLPELNQILQLRNRESDLLSIELIDNAIIKALFNTTIASTVENNNLDHSIIPKFNKWTENIITFTIENITRFLEKNIIY